MTSLPSRAADTLTVTGIIEAERNAPKPCPKPGPKAKKQRNLSIDKRAVLLARFGGLEYLPCECGCGGFGHDLHHAFIGRKAGHPELDDDRNLVLVNHDEHIARKFDNRKSKKYFWAKQCKRFTYPVMMEWVNSLPKKMRSRIDWI